MKAARKLPCDRHLAPVLDPALERPDPDGRHVQVDIARAERQDLSLTRAPVWAKVRTNV